MLMMRKTVRLHRVQQAFRRSNALLRGFVGGRGAGKSWVGAYDLLRRAKPRRLYLVGAPTYPMLRDASWRSLQDLAVQMRFIKKLNNSELYMRLGNGAEIIGRSADNPERFRGPNLSGLWLDEASQAEKAAFEIGLACLRQEGEQGWFSATFTPRGKQHWTYEVFGQTDAEGKPLRPNTSLFTARTRDNPFLRQAMATLCRQLHAPDPRDGIFRWSLAALQRKGFEALLVFHYTVTAVNELREPLHDEVFSTVFRIEGDRLTPVEDTFQQIVLGSEFYPIKSNKSQEEWVRTFRGKWFKHRGELEGFLRAQEKSLHTLLQGRAEATLQRESAAAKESYRSRLRELEDRSREQDLNKLAKALLRQQAEAMKPTLFEEIQEEATYRAQEIEEQMTVLRRDVERTRDLLKKERDKRLNVVLPKRFHLRELRPLPLALVYLVPATKEDVRP